MRRAAALALALLLAAATAGAAPERGEIGLSQIAEARALLAEAEAALAASPGGRQRAEALDLAVRAHEAALAALRTGLRALAAEDRRLAEALGTERRRMATILAALQSVSRAPRSALLLHPDGALSAARAGPALADMTPRLRAAMAEIGRRIDGLRSLRLNQEIARAEAKGALSALQALRAEAAHATRRGGRELDPETRAALEAQAREARARADDLDDLARVLRARGAEAAPEPFETRRGRLIPPVAGERTGSFGGVDPWGRTGQGIAYTAPAYAEVRAPASGTIRYAGPLIDYGEVVILEPEAGWLIVLAGLAATDRRVGETVTAGERLGDLGGPLPSSEEFLLEAGGAVPKIETSDLYVELRRDGTALDPTPWFRGTSE